MVSEYHKFVEKCIVDFGKGYSSVKKVFRGNRVPISIVEPKSKKVVNYQPDVYYILKNRRKLVFEILESEVKKQDIIIADITRSCLIENCKGIIFIHPSTKTEDEGRIIEALYTIVKGLNKKGIPIEELPQLNRVYSIQRSLIGKSDKVLKKFNEYAKKDKW